MLLGFHGNKNYSVANQDDNPLLIQSMRYDNTEDRFAQEPVLRFDDWSVAKKLLFWYNIMTQG